MILNWFSHIRVVTEDDKADFAVMLLDHNNTDDAYDALMGIQMNIFKHGLNLGLLDLLLLAAQPDNAERIRDLGLFVLIGSMILYDDAIRKQEDFIEQFLEILSYEQETAFDFMCQLGFIRSHMIVIGAPMKDIKDTLVYQLIVVGEEASQAFDRSCC